LRFGFDDPLGAAMRTLFAKSHETLLAARLGSPPRGGVRTPPQSGGEALGLLPADGENVYDAAVLSWKSVAGHYDKIAKSERMRKRRIRAAEKRAAKAEKTKLWYEKKAVWEKRRAVKEERLGKWREKIKAEKEAKAARAAKRAEKAAAKAAAKAAKTVKPRLPRRNLDDAVAHHIEKMRKRGLEREAKLLADLKAGLITKRHYDTSRKMADFQKKRQQKLRDEFEKANPGKSLWRETVAGIRAKNAEIKRDERRIAREAREAGEVGEVYM